MLKLKLFILMVLQLFIWGAWLPVIFGYLGNPPLSFNETQQSWVLNAFAIGSFAAMFFSTPFADRMFPAEKFLAASHLVGGGSILALTWVTDFNTFFILMLVHCLAYVPTLSIANGLAFSHLTDAKGEFGLAKEFAALLPPPAPPQSEFSPPLPPEETAPAGADQPVAVADAGTGSAAATAMASVMKQIETTLQQELVDAYEQGGDAQVAIVKDRQDQMMAKVRGGAPSPSSRTRTRARPR